MIKDDQPKPKQPYHDYTSNQILKEREKINDPSESLNAAMRMGVYLGTLHNSTMPAVEAHRLAELHEDLPSFLHRSTQPNLSFFAEVVLHDLRNRKPDWMESRNLERQAQMTSTSLPAAN